jgi:hypothetical protein
LQAKLHRGVKEALHGVKGNHQLFRDVIKGKFHLKAVIAHDKVFILVLEDNGHFAGVALGHALADVHAGKLRVEGNIKMMPARQA